MYLVTLDNVPWFPNHGVQIGVAVGYLICLPTMSVLLYTRFPFVETATSISKWRMPYSKFTILVALFASWCYIFVGGVLNLGVGLSSSLTECSRGIFLCTWFYTLTKLGVYLFLMERAFIVRGGGIRLQSWHYRFNFVLMACWLVVFVLLEAGRLYALGDDGVCTFGWDWWALIPLMSLDVFVNLYLLAMFVIPLFRNQFTNHKLRTLAIKSLWTSVGSVAATMANLIMLIMIDAPGWLCLASCGIDVFANALLLFYMTRTMRADDNEAKATWTMRQYNLPDTNHSGRTGRTKRTMETMDDEYEMGDKFNGVTTKIEAVDHKHTPSEPSIADNESDREILPSTRIHVSHRVDYDSNSIV